MPMSTNRYVIDGANVLRAEAQADLTAQFDGPVIKFVETDAYWQAGHPVKNGDLAQVVAQVTKIADAGTTLKFSLMVADDAAKTNAVEAQAFDVAKVGQVAFEIDEFSIKEQYPAKTHWFLRAVPANATPANISYNFSAFIAPDAS